MLCSLSLAVLFVQFVSIDIYAFGQHASFFVLLFVLDVSSALLQLVFSYPLVFFSVYTVAYTLHAFSFLPLFVSHLPICTYMWLYFAFAHMRDFCMIPDNKQLAFFFPLSLNLCVYSSNKNQMQSCHCLSLLLFAVQFDLKFISYLTYNALHQYAQCTP